MSMIMKPLLAGQDDTCTWPEPDETSACAMCYTSGTTGNPKGVLYSHRSLLLHTLSVSLLDADGPGVNDVILPLVPMFHVNAWGLPFRAPLVGAGIVFPHRYMGNPQVVSRLIAQEKVTYGVSVPTIWQMLLDYLDQAGETWNPCARRLWAAPPVRCPCSSVSGTITGSNLSRAGG